jgi:hypothetical protein
MEAPEHTVLLVADDLRILGLARAVLAGKDRVLVAYDAQNAIRLLDRGRARIHSVGIRAGVGGEEEVRAWSLRRGAKPWTFRGEVSDQSVILEPPDSGADWDSAA